MSTVTRLRAACLRADTRVRPAGVPWAAERLPLPALQARMQFCFNQALMCCYFTPQVWHEAAVWMADHGNVPAAHSFYERALEVLPANGPLTLAYTRLQVHAISTHLTHISHTSHTHHTHTSLRGPPCPPSRFVASPHALPPGVRGEGARGP